jgi:transposase
MIELRDIILQLRRGCGIKHIHRTTGHHRTVIRTLKAIAEARDWLNPQKPPPDEAAVREAWVSTTACGTKHQLDCIREDLLRWHKEGISFVVMHRLATERVSCSESTIRRYVQRLCPPEPQPVVARTFIPGDCMDVDFGLLGLVEDERTESIRKAWVFSARLRYSRKAYRAIVFSQSQEVFFACHIEAFEWFGGVPATVVLDNVKAGILKASWDDPLATRAYHGLAEHYGFAISACRPYTPEHKGGVENDMRYIKRSFWPEIRIREEKKGHTIPRFSRVIEYLSTWNDQVSEPRDVGKVGRTVQELFSEEIHHLKPLPSSRWEPEHWAFAKVQSDWQIQFDKAFYSVPYRFIGKTVLLKATHTTVRIFLESDEIAVHARANHHWQHQVVADHGPPKAAEYLATSTKGLILAAEAIGPATGRFAQAILADRAVDGIRPLRALVHLQYRYSCTLIEQYAQKLLAHDIVSYTSLKNELKCAVEHAGTPAPSFRFARDPAYYRDAAEVSHG